MRSPTDWLRLIENLETRHGLGRIARAIRVLSVVQPSSSQSERMMSAAKHVMRDTRTLLSDDVFEALVMLRVNTSGTSGSCAPTVDDWRMILDESLALRSSSANEK